jgi:hypothetical protein
MISALLEKQSQVCLSTPAVGAWAPGLVSVQDCSDTLINREGSR